MVLDSVGDWENFSETVSGVSLDQQRTFNTVNEITDISKTVGINWADPGYDAAGNMNLITRRANPAARWRATWDAWNRLVKVEERDAENNWIAKQENAYDAQNRRIVRKTYASGSLTATRHYYWTANWQGIEERVEVSSVQEPERQYVYGLRYIDDVVLRDRDTNVDDTGSSSDALVYDERIYAMQDASWNVVALCDDLGTVQRRYAYLPYGDVLALNGSFGSGGPNLQWTKRFASYEYDNAVDLCQVRWRWYSPLLGNWVSRDPARNARREPNRYRYCKTRPMNFVDALGLEIRRIDNILYVHKMLTGPSYAEYAELQRKEWGVRFHHNEYSIYAHARLIIAFECKCENGVNKAYEIDSPSSNDAFTTPGHEWIDRVEVAKPPEIRRINVNGTEDGYKVNWWVEVEEESNFQNALAVGGVVGGVTGGAGYIIGGETGGVVGGFVGGLVGMVPVVVGNAVYDEVFKTRLEGEWTVSCDKNGKLVFKEANNRPQPQETIHEDFYGDIMWIDHEIERYRNPVHDRPSDSYDMWDRYPKRNPPQP